MTKILGISAFYHDSAAAIIIDGKIIAAAQEERFQEKSTTQDIHITQLNLFLILQKLNFLKLII